MVELRTPKNVLEKYRHVSNFALKAEGFDILCCAILHDIQYSVSHEALASTARHLQVLLRNVPPVLRLSLTL